MGIKNACFVILLAAGVFLPGAGQAFEVHDSINYGQLVKQLNELKKQVEQIQKVAGYAQGIQQRLGDLSEGGLTLDAWISRGQFLGQCIAPELMNFKLPDGVKPQWVDLCQGVKSAESLLLYNPDEKYNGKPLPASEQTRLLNDRRDKIQAEAVVKAMATAKQSIASAGDLDNAAQGIIDRSNAAVDVPSIQRETNRALANMLREMKQQRILLAQMLELQAATQARNLPTFPIDTKDNNQ